MKKSEYAREMGLCEEAIDGWEETKPDQECEWCDAPTWNGAGHYQEEMGYDHPNGEDRICGDCFAKWRRETN